MPQTRGRNRGEKQLVTRQVTQAGPSQHRGVASSSKRHNRTSVSSHKTLCYRIREIPGATTKNEVEKEIRNALKFEADNRVDLRLTLARSTDKHQTATLMSNTPPELKYPV